MKYVIFASLIASLGAVSYANAYECTLSAGLKSEGRVFAPWARDKKTVEVGSLEQCLAAAKDYLAYTYPVQNPDEGTVDTYGHSDVKYGYSDNQIQATGQLTPSNN